ncbi:MULTISPECIES: hypothetical protein [unclassified Dyella]|uniref:hypothetical protein n=1 Tax=Dyella sp. ASV21 TaxID=2795114 RepID=UPI0018EB78F8|nr:MULTISPECIES: hypothetical protein [unclassified Dyella]
MGTRLTKREKLDILIDIGGVGAQFCLTFSAATAIYAAQPDVVEPAASRAICTAEHFLFVGGALALVNMIGLLVARNSTRTIPTFVAYYLTAIATLVAYYGNNPVKGLFVAAAIVICSVATVVAGYLYYRHRRSKDTPDPPTAQAVAGPDQSQR